jgi:enoyl-CoA hydratase
MGGGAGISIHGSHRVGTKNLVFAMPETGIGFYPDVGTTYYLARFPHKIGIYLGLTGVKISYADCLALGIVQEIVEPESLDQIVSALRETIITDNNSVTKILKLFSTPVSHSELLQHQQEIEACFAKNTVEDIIKTLENYGSEWCQQTAKLLSTKSPTSLKVTLMALQKASHLTFDECMQMEYGLTCHFIKKHDFFEGIRAVIIDKDQNPHWHPITLQQTTEQEIEEYFVLQSAEKNHTHVPGAGSDKQHPETPPDANERFREGEQEGK